MKRKRNCQYVDSDTREVCKKLAVSSKSKTGVQGMCVSHGGGDRCQFVDPDTGKACKASAQNSKSKTGVQGMCKSHGGGDRCQFVDPDTGKACKASAVSSKSKTGVQGMCVSHGGGDRCQFVDPDTGKACKASAVSSKSKTGVQGMCKSHGGGDRCQFVDPDTGKACKASAVSSKSKTGVQGMCKSHGGGDRCQFVDPDTGKACKASAQNSKSKTGVQGMCKSHGGGDRCQFVDPDTGKACKASARTSTDKTGVQGMCVSHGGGDRCQAECCALLDVQSYAPYCMPAPDGRTVCTHYARCAVSIASSKSPEEGTKLARHFGFKKDLVMRGEHAFYHALCQAVPELKSAWRTLDEPQLKKQLGKAKCMGDPRPDYFHEYEGGAIHGEYDEKRDHEMCVNRELIVATLSKAGPARTYAFRVLGRHDEPDAVCERRVYNKHYTYFTLTAEGRRVVSETAVVVRRILSWISQGLPPDDAAGRPRRTLINF
jgi:hypothetical protein